MQPMYLMQWIKAPINSFTHLYQMSSIIIIFLPVSAIIR